MRTLSDMSLILVKYTAGLVGKKPLARRAGVPVGCLRRLLDNTGVPTAPTLGKLEGAAWSVLEEFCPDAIPGPSAATLRGAPEAEADACVSASASHDFQMPCVSSPAPAGAGNPAPDFLHPNSAKAA